MRCSVCQKVTIYGGRVTFGTIRWCFKVAFPRERYFEDRGEIAAGQCAEASIATFPGWEHAIVMVHRLGLLEKQHVISCALRDMPNCGKVAFPRERHFETERNLRIRLLADWIINPLSAT